MSKNRNRARLNKASNNQEYRRMLLMIFYPPYFDDGVHMYPSYRKGYKNPLKQIYNVQRRSYRTWKHNRKTQWR